MAGLRIAVTTTVGLATLAFFAGAGGLGEQIFADITFKSNVVVAGGLCVLLAVVLDLLVLRVQKALTPWTRAAAHDATFAVLGEFGDAIDFIFTRARVAGGGVAGRRLRTTCRCCGST